MYASITRRTNMVSSRRSIRLRPNYASRQEPSSASEEEDSRNPQRGFLMYTQVRVFKTPGLPSHLHYIERVIGGLW
jgi:hypothetical protein